MTDVEFLRWVRGFIVHIPGGHSESYEHGYKRLARITNQFEAQEKEIESLRKSIIRAYNNGYLSGHHDTVEAVFTDIHQCDISTYHSDIVEEANWFKNKDD